MSSGQLYLYGFVVFYFMLLNKFAASQTLICAVGNQEDKVRRITCPSGSIISDVRFASYGNPEGSCGSYTIGSCHASNSMNIVSNECLNQTTCSLTPSHTIFDFNECHDEAMQLYAEVLCSVSSSNMSISTSTFSRLSISSSIVSSSVCLDGWILYNSKCYYFNQGSSTHRSWSDCQSYCSSLGASMLCIPDSTTNTWIANQLQSQLGGSYTWIGYLDYKWISGCTSSYSNRSVFRNDLFTYIFSYDGSWFGAGVKGNLPCSCEYSIVPTSRPTLSPTSPTANPSILPTLKPSFTFTPTVGCQLGWEYYNNNCYKFNVSISTWSGCETTCSSVGASMLCIPDSTTNSWIGNQVFSSNLYYTWIGYSDLPNKDGNYKWTSGCRSTYVKNYFDNLFNLFNCAWILSDGSWSGTTTSITLPCTCQYYPGPSMSPTVLLTSPTVFPSAPPTVTPTVGCQPGWVYYNNKCYYFSFGKYYSWSECKSECTSLGASMLCIPDDATNSWIANFQLNRNSYTWIGYSDLPNKDRNYKWVSGCSSTYINIFLTYSSDKIDCIYMSSIGGGIWSSSYDSGANLISCSCEYQIHSGPSFLPTNSPTTPTANPSSIVTTFSCRSGWINYNNKCYNFNIGNGYSWSTCKSKCALLDTSMLCITDSATNKWIVNRLGYSFSWIGYSNLARGIYEWVPGCTSSYTDAFFFMAYKDFALTSAFGWFSSDDNDIFTSSTKCSCEYSLGPSSLPTLSPTSPTVYPTLLPSFILSMVPSVKPTITPTAACQQEWKDYNNKCYYFNAGFYLSWSECKSKCTSFGASMLCIPDSTTNSWIANELSNLRYYYSWIGYYDSGYGNFKWVSGCSSRYSRSFYDGNYERVKIGRYGYWSTDYDSGYSSIMCSCEYSRVPTSLPTLSPTFRTVNPTAASTIKPSSLLPSSISPTNGCRSGWIIYNNKCYNFNLGTGFTWSACKSACASLDASMLCITDSSTNSWISSVSSSSSSSWIGYSDLPYKDGKYKWIYGCSSSYSSSYFNNYYNCAYINSNGYWYSFEDSGSSSIMCSCEYNNYTPIPIAPSSLPTVSLTSPTIRPSILPSNKPTISASSPTVNPSVVLSTPPSSSSVPSIIPCLPGWSNYNNNCYNLNIGTSYTWSGCQSQCTSLGASMLCIPDSTTNSWIANQLLELGYSYSWIGYSDLPNKDRNYKWESGCSSSYTNWDINSNYYNYDCAYMASDGFWGSTSDDGSTRTICICEYNPEPTSLPTILPTVTTEPTTSSSTISPTYNQNTSSSSSSSTTTSTTTVSSSISLGAIIGIVLGSIFIITVTIGGSFALWTRMHDAKVAIDDSKYNDNSSSKQESNITPSYPDEEHPITAFVELPIAEADNVHYYTDDVLPTTNKGVIENI